MEELYAVYLESLDQDLRVFEKENLRNWLETAGNGREVVDKRKSSCYN